MLKLYEIANEYRRLADSLDASDTSEEMTQTIRDTMESLAFDFEDKAEAMAALVAEYEATIEGCKAEIRRLTGKAARADNAIDSIKKYLFSEMQYTGLRKVKAGTWNISISRNGGKAPVVYKEFTISELPERFQKTTVTLDTAAVRDALEAGEALDFAELGERGESLRIK